MKKPGGPPCEHAETELRQYVLDRPGLLLKMLDIAETCERKQAADSTSTAAKASTPHRVAACG